MYERLPHADDWDALGQDDDIVGKRCRDLGDGRNACDINSGEGIRPGIRGQDELAIGAGGDAMGRGAGRDRRDDPHGARVNDGHGAAAVVGDCHRMCGGKPRHQGGARADRATPTSRRVVVSMAIS